MRVPQVCSAPIPSCGRGKNVTRSNTNNSIKSIVYTPTYTFLSFFSSINRHLYLAFECHCVPHYTTTTATTTAIASLPVCVFSVYRHHLLLLPPLPLCLLLSSYSPFAFYRAFPAEGGTVHGILHGTTVGSGVVGRGAGCNEPHTQSPEAVCTVGRTPLPPRQ